MFSGTRQRKMKQGRLPFSPVDSKGSKRKLSAADEYSPKSTKVLCSDEKKATPYKKKNKSLFPSSKLKCSEGTADEMLTEVNDKVIEEKENVHSDDAVAEQLNSGPPVEDSNDGFEVILVKAKDKNPQFSLKPTQKISSNKRIKKHSSKITTAKGKNADKFQKSKTKNVEKPAPLNKSIDEMFKSLQGKQKNHVACGDSGNIINVIVDGDLSDEELPSVDKSEADSSVGSKSFQNSLPANKSMNSSDSSEICSSETDEKNQAAPSSFETIGPLGQLSPSKRKALLCTKRKGTPAQKKKRELLKLKEECRLQAQMENEKKKQELEEAKQEKKRKKMEEQELKEKVKEEKRLKREEEKLKKEEKKEEERQKKEEERQKKEEEKQKKEEEKQKKEEEKQKKEEEKQKKEDERLLAEEELKREQQKRKAQFARFFVSKKETPSSQGKDVISGQQNFILFQVKENMRMAPPVRSSLSAQNRQILDEAILSSLSSLSSPNYLREIACQDYIKGQSFKTFPSIEPDDYCEILSDDDDEAIDGTDLLQENKSLQPKKKQRAKLFQFCENSRPAYYGTWSKRPIDITGRRPFSKEKVFDYDYDSDEDWEEVENGESLSDSDGEPEGEEAAEEDYEVDNDFFVPHGYLSDGEGEEKEDASDQQEDDDAVDACKQPKDENIQEKLKQKQEEFELEMKQKTKPLKPKVYGCVWLGDQTSHPAYTQLVKILSLHRSQVMVGTCPLDIDTPEAQPSESKDPGEEEEDATKKFVKSFPEKAVADLIRLIHGNRFSKVFLVREFSEYWKRKQCETPEEGDLSSTGCIAKRKIEPKIQEIAQYGKFSEDGVIFKYRTWYVPKEIRKKYGLEDLSLRNAWTYTLTPKEWRKCDTSNKEEKEESAGSESCTPKSSNVNLITKFTKVLSEEEEKKKLNAKFSSPKAITSKDSSPTPSTKKLNAKFPSPKVVISKDSSTIASTSTYANHSNSLQSKNGVKGTPPSTKKVPVKKKFGKTLLSKAKAGSPKSTPIASFFKNAEMNKKISRNSPPNHDPLRKGQEVESEPECITVD